MSLYGLGKVLLITVVIFGLTLIIISQHKGMSNDEEMFARNHGNVVIFNTSYNGIDCATFPSDWFDCDKYGCHNVPQDQINGIHYNDFFMEGGILCGAKQTEEDCINWQIDYYEKQHFYLGGCKNIEGNNFICCAQVENITINHFPPYEINRRIDYCECWFENR